MKTADLLHKLPTVTELLETPRLKRLVERVNQSTVATSVRSVLDDVRVEYQRARMQQQAPSISELAERIARRVLLGSELHARPLINATGELVHARCGTPPLAEAALDALVILGRDFASLEIDSISGKPAARDEEAAALLTELTGCEAAMVVNNLAGGLLLTVASVAKGKEVIVARSQLIETTNGERLSDLLTAAGALVKEVGAANKTEIADYVQAMGPQTGAILVVSEAAEGTPKESTNGSANSVSLAKLSELSRSHQVPLVQLFESATLLDVTDSGIANGQWLTAGNLAAADLSIARSEGWIGGPEAGLILGQREIVQSLKKNVLAFGVRADKLTLAALGATLRLYRDPAQAKLQIPVLSLLTTSAENLRLRAEHIAPQLAALPGVGSVSSVGRVGVIDRHAGNAQDSLSTWCVQLELQDGQVSGLAKSLRMGQPAVYSREEGQHLLFDLRSVLPRQDIELVSAVQGAIHS